MKWILSLIVRKKLFPYLRQKAGRKLLLNTFPGFSEFERKLKVVAGTILMIFSTPFLLTSGIIFYFYQFQHWIWLLLILIPGLGLLISGAYLKEKNKRSTNFIR